MKNTQILIEYMEMQLEIAHVKQLSDGSWAEPHSLIEHLNGTADLAEQFAGKFNSSIWGKTLGLAHDQGKSTEKWQKYLRLKSGYFDDEAHLEGKAGKVDHSTAGAKLTEEIYGKLIGRFLGYCIAGHHAGLPDWNADGPEGKCSLHYRLSNCSNSELTGNYIDLLRNIKIEKCPWLFDNTKIDLALWIRMLFSCLVDADFLDTEKYMNIEQSEERFGYKSMNELLSLFNVYMSEKTKNAEKTIVNIIRQSILSDCRKAAEKRPGIFSLTVPTGGGKTLSSLAFALEHAVKYNLDRIIYVIPYTSIIEQNASVFKYAVGEDQVIEHHSNLDIDDSTTKTRLAAENWDAPLIVTTSVQFFESLFAAKSSRCRKLHNIVNSVIILDEAQLVPVDYLQPILQTMELLSKNYNVTFVISTATQPAFEKRTNFNGLPENSITEIISNVSEIYQKLDRVTIHCPDDYNKSTDWMEIAEKMDTEKQVLCIVSDRKSCRELYKMLKPGAYHLSALMCGQHRSDIINEIKLKLKNNLLVKVVSTQLVEAGVDLDFPVVYRALAGLDSIAQAAGRCNREGKLERGHVHIFVPPKKAPPGILRKAAETTATMLLNGLIKPLDHKNFEQFFSELYWKASSLDVNGIINLLKPDDFKDCGIQFRTAAEKFRIIDDSMQKTILVPYCEGEQFLELLKKNGPERRLLRKLQRYSVNIYTRDFIQMQTRGALIEVAPDLFALATTIDYDYSTGLNVEEITYDPDKLIL